MQENTTWEQVLKFGNAACHGPTGESLELHKLDSVDTVDINSIMIIKRNMRYSLYLEVGFKFCDGLTKEQVIEKLQELSALDKDWE